jgi:hypothetical protein
LTPYTLHLSLFYLSEWVNHDPERTLKVTILHPAFGRQFLKNVATFNVRDFEQKITKPEKFERAYEWTYNHRNDFDVAVMPFYFVDSNLWNNDEKHFVLAIFSRTNAIRAFDTVVFDPKKKMKNGHIFCKTLLKYAIGTLLPYPKKCQSKIVMSREEFHLQPENDSENSILFVLSYAANFLKAETEGKAKDKEFNLQKALDNVENNFRKTFGSSHCTKLSNFGKVPIPSSEQYENFYEEINDLQTSLSSKVQDHLEEKRRSARLKKNQLQIAERARRDEEKLEEDRKKDRIRKQKGKKKTFPIYNYKDCQAYVLGKFAVVCSNPDCQAIFFPEERVYGKTTFNICCNHCGVVVELETPDKLMKELWLGKHPKHENFHKNIIAYNSTFSFASMTVHNQDDNDDPLKKHGNFLPGIFPFSFIICYRIF